MLAHMLRYNPFAQAYAGTFQDGELLALKGMGHGILISHTWPNLAEAMHERVLRPTVEARIRTIFSLRSAQRPS